MIKTANKISFLIESQLPDFINEEYELFSKFIQKYYEQLEIQGQPLDIISNIQNYRDIDFYENDILKQSTTLVGVLSDADPVITVDDATSFPENGGYIKIDDEICFYASRTETQFLDVSRGVSGNTTLGDLYTKSNFVTTQSSTHLNGSTVQNISNLFLYALVKSFEKQYLADFPEAYLKEEVDKRTLIKNITNFYQSKGTDNSIKFLFKCLIKDDPNPSILYPRDFTVKSSDSNWINNYSLKVKIVSGNPIDLIGNRIVQTTGTYASAVVDNVRYTGKYDGDELYEIILAEESVNGYFSISNKTRLTKDITSLDTIGSRVNVFSTLGWDKEGQFFIGGETFSYKEKNVNQFVISDRTANGVYPIGSTVTYGHTVSGSNVTVLVYGILYGVENNESVPYSNAGDTIDISEPGFTTDDIRIFDDQNNIRWELYGISPAVPGLNSNVSAIFEDVDSYYIASSGWPSHVIGTGISTDGTDQKNLKIIRKRPISTTESYETKYRDIGIATNGIPFLSYKDEDAVYSGPIESISIINRGTGYNNSPFVLVNNTPNIARSKLAGQVVESVIVDVPGEYDTIPTVDIVSGRNAKASAVVTNGEITSLIIDDPGEYYSHPPQIRIADKVGKGRYANYVAEVSTSGQITGFTKITGGNLYTHGNVVVDIIPDGSGATGTASIKEWRKDRYYKHNITNSNLDFDNGYKFYNIIPSKGHGYAYYASPSTLRANDNGGSHSAILGFAYDGNPIYGAYGYYEPLDSTSAISQMSSSYSLNTARVGGPAEDSSNPLGSFINDYTYIPGYGTLDENNGRFCVTPEFPDGTYAYFVTVNSSNEPVFPYIIGKNYYSIPVDSNYNSEISQDDIPNTALRLRTGGIDKNGDLTTAQIAEVTRGTVSSATIVSSGNNFSVGNELVIDNSDTGGSGAVGEVSSVKGSSVVSLDSQSSKVLYFDLSNIGYLFAGDTITQANTGATGTLIGDVISAKTFVLKNVTGTFNSTDVLSSNTEVISLILDKSSSYTKGSILVLEDGIAVEPVAKGEVLESTTNQNSVKVRVTKTGFVPSTTLFLSSENLNDTTGSKIFSITPLSSNLSIFEITDNVALITTSVPHNVNVGADIDVDINPDDNTTTTNYFVRSRIYQEVTLKNLVISRVLSDTGIGRIEILNSGANYTNDVYDDIALSGGTGNGAKAKITVENNLVTKVEITEKGTGYNKFDLLTVGDTALGKTDTSEPRIAVRVDHVGFSSENSKLHLDSSLDIKINDHLIIGDEIVKVEGIVDNTVVVQRGSNKVDHFDGAVVAVHDPGYNLSNGYRINSTGVVTEDSNNAIVLSYDSVTQKVVFVYDYNQSLTSIDSLSLTSVFFDESSPKSRLVEIESYSSPQIYFEFSTDGSTFTRNPIINIKKYYKYNFDVTHSSMTGKKFNISPSINFNIVTPELLKVPPLIDLKLGFGARTDSNTYANKEEVYYSKYYYFDENSIVSSEGSYFNVVEDPLQGSKKSLYTTSIDIVYSTGIKASHDGSGSISYNTKSPFAIGEIASVDIVNIGIDYSKIPVVTGIYDNDGFVDKTVECYLNSNDIGVPTSIKIFNNGGLYHNDFSLQSTFRSNYVLILSGFNKDAFGVGETVIQKSGSVETARAKVTSWREGSNILLIDNVTGVFKKGLPIIGLANRNIATLDDIKFTSFKPNIKTYFDNLGYYGSDYGKISDSNQKIHDSYYYQDYSYLIKSKTPVDNWRSLIKETTHPAGFQLFGEVLIESSGQNRMPGNTSVSRVSVIQAWNPEKNKITVQSTKKQITQNIVLMKNLNVEKGVGSASLDTASLSEISAGNLFLDSPFNGSLTNKGNLEGRTTFTLKDINGHVVKPYNEQSLIITLDGILQEPGVSYTISGDQITFAQPPLGPSVKNEQDIPGVTFYGKLFEFKKDSLNQRYLKKIRNIFQRTGTWIDAANQLEMNRTFIQEETLGYIKNKYPVLSWGSLESKCIRDIGLFIDAIAHDLRFGGNEKTIIAAESYFTNDTLTSLIGDAVLVDPSEPNGDKISELEATIEAFSYMNRLAKLAMRNWDYIDRQVSWTPGTNQVTISDTNNIALGMRVSAGRAFPKEARVIQIVDDRNIRIGRKLSDTEVENINSLPLAETSVNIISDNTTLDDNTNTVSSITQVGEGFYLRIGSSVYYALTPADSALPSDNAQMIFSFSPLNDGTYYDASLLIERNKSDIIASAIAAVDAKYPSHALTGYTAKCERDLGYLIDAVNYSLRYGGNEKIIHFARSFFVGNDMTHLYGELPEALYAFHQARDLMIKAMRNQGAVTDSSIRIDNQVPLCAQIESAIATYVSSAEVILERGVNAVELIRQNNNDSGYWSNTQSYTNINILPDPQLVNGVLKECEDVSSALDSLYENVRQTLNTGVGTSSISKPDYINNENNIFELYYTDGTAVDTEVNEDLFVALSGVLQHTTSYYIDRTTVPNKIVFDAPPIWGQNENTKTVYEPLAVEKFFAHGVGAYLRCTINTNDTKGSNGPFLILDSKDQSKIISAPEFALVFIDGVLQREKNSYIINGPTITFNRNIYRGNNVEMIVLYGRDLDSSISLYDFESNEYYNEILLTCDAGSANDFAAWKKWFGLSHDDHQVAYQKINGEKVFIGNVKTYTTTNQKLIINLSGNNPAMDGSSVFFSGTDNFFGAEDFNDEYELTGTTNTISVVRNSYNDYRMQRNSARWLYGSKKADNSFYEKHRGSANLIAGDSIRIHGEDDYRTIKELPQYVSPKTYNAGEEVSNNFFGSCFTTDYIGNRRGEGLSVTCQVTNGEVSSITWNKTTYNAQNQVEKRSDAKGYDTTPILHFIPIDQKGGGARAEVIVCDGEIVDIVLTNSGSGYTTAPAVVTARQYDLIKQRGRKIDSLINIKVETELLYNTFPGTIIPVDITPIRGTDPVSPIPLDPNLPGDKDPDGYVRSSLASSNHIQITEFINRRLDVPSPDGKTLEVNRYFPTVVDSVRLPDISHTSQGTSILELGAYDARMFKPFVWITAKGIITVPPGPGPGPGPGFPPGYPGNPDEKVYTYQLGFVDHRGFVKPPRLENMTMRPSFFQWEGAKFMSTGDILSPAGHSVSEYTIEEFDRYGFNLLQFSANAYSGWADDGYSFNIGYPTINNYLSQVEVDNLPSEFQGGFVRNGGVIYASTRLFPSSGVISIGKEKIYYSNKLSDRFLGCQRGFAGSIIEEHPVGSYLRNA